MGVLRWYSVWCGGVVYEWYVCIVSGVLSTKVTGNYYMVMGMGNKSFVGQLGCRSGIPVDKDFPL